MSTLDERMAEIRENRGAVYYEGLIAISGGSIENAARLDLVYDGRLSWADLRRSPFAGDEELRELLRTARDAQNQLHARIIELSWQRGREVMDHTDGSNA
ncbi:hypothetical protein [Microbacterium arborescens]